MHYSVSVRNARLDAVQHGIGPAPKLMIYSGPVPKGADAPPIGKLLVVMKLPEAWMDRAKDGSKTSAGKWEGKAVATAHATYFRIVGLKGRAQGRCGPENSQADLRIKGTTTELVEGQDVSVHAFTLKAMA